MQWDDEKDILMLREIARNGILLHKQEVENADKGDIPTESEGLIEELYNIFTDTEKKK